MMPFVSELQDLLSDLVHGYRRSVFIRQCIQKDLSELAPGDLRICFTGITRRNVKRAGSGVSLVRVPVPREKAELAGVALDVKAPIVFVGAITPFVFVEMLRDKEAMGSMPVDLCPAGFTGWHIDRSENVGLGQVCSCLWQSKFQLWETHRK
jgi:hypothetical protein